MKTQLTLPIKQKPKPGKRSSKIVGFPPKVEIKNIGGGGKGGGGGSFVSSYDYSFIDVKL